MIALGIIAALLLASAALGIAIDAYLRASALERRVEAQAESQRVFNSRLSNLSNAVAALQHDVRALGQHAAAAPMLSGHVIDNGVKFDPPVIPSASPIEVNVATAAKPIEVPLEMILAAVVEQKAWEVAHPVPYRPTQRLEAIRQRVVRALQAQDASV